MKLIKITAETAQTASEIYCKSRDESGEGASTWPDGIWDGHRISYNGRVWSRDGKVIYPSKDDSPDFWHDSCA